MKPQLPALVMSVSPASRAVQSSASIQTKEGLRTVRNEAACANDTGSLNDPEAFKMLYREGAGTSRTSRISASFNRRIDHMALPIRTKKKRFG